MSYLILNSRLAATGPDYRTVVAISTEELQAREKELARLIQDPATDPGKREEYRQRRLNLVDIIQTRKLLPGVMKAQVGFGKQFGAGSAVGLGSSSPKILIKRIDSALQTNKDLSPEVTSELTGLKEQLSGINNNLYESLDKVTRTYKEMLVPIARRLDQLLQVREHSPEVEELPQEQMI
jgi:hypothetical protein